MALLRRRKYNRRIRTSWNTGAKTRRTYSTNYKYRPRRRRTYRYTKSKPFTYGKRYRKRRIINSLSLPAKKVITKTKHIHDICLLVDRNGSAASSIDLKAIKWWFPSDDGNKKRQKAIWDKYESHRIKSWTIYIKYKGCSATSIVKTAGATNDQMIPVSVPNFGNENIDIGVWNRDEIDEVPASGEAYLDAYKYVLNNRKKTLKFHRTFPGMKWFGQGYDTISKSENSFNFYGTGPAAYTGSIAPIWWKEGKQEFKLTEPTFRFQIDTPNEPDIKQKVLLSKNYSEDCKITTIWKANIKLYAYATWEHGGPRYSVS
ncbi:putative capsid protein [Longjawed orbweaver circular virus 2]|uniref:putative capsid protein n=1 Tax=Longjawed orbweaver circular virus 2 TaxID=2293295 RepID=UPI000E334EA3|nr:putative capsid protein [Longjawed orbweaver circular virus 2]AXL65920.1 putative capsid protein [Longjawed orbweaver circular virus 2]